MVIPINGIEGNGNDIQASFRFMILIYLCYSRSPNRIYKHIPYLNTNSIEYLFFNLIMVVIELWYVVCVCRVVGI